MKMPGPLRLTLLFLLVWIIGSAALYLLTTALFSQPSSYNDEAGQALTLDGVDDYMVVPHDEAFNFGADDDFTIEAWVRFTGTAGTGSGTPGIIEKWDNTPTQYPFVLRTRRSNGQFSCNRWDEQTSYELESIRTGLNDGVWHHVACVHEGAARRFTLYVDGEWNGSTTYDTLSSFTNTSALYVGQRGNAEETQFRGQIDDVRIWNVARTEAEILDAMQTPLRGNETGLVAFWRFDTLAPRGTTTTGSNTVADVSGNAHHGEFFGEVVVPTRPWYQTLWASALFVLGVLALVLGTRSGFQRYHRWRARMRQSGTHAARLALPRWVVVLIWLVGCGALYFLTAWSFSQTRKTASYAPEAGQALALDGIDDFVVVPHNEAFNFDADDDFTIEAWIRLANTFETGMGSPVIIGKWDTAGRYPFMLRMNRPRGEFVCARWDGVTHLSVHSRRFDLTDGVWHHVVCGHSSTTKRMAIFVDGLWSGDLEYDSLGTTANTSALYLGRRGLVDQGWFGGQIDQVRIWNTVLSAEEILDFSRKPLTGDEPGLVANWRFDDLPRLSLINTRRAALKDASVNAHHGTLVGLLQPWHRTPWASALFVLGVIALVLGAGYGFDRYRMRHFQARTRELEQTVAERTEQIRQQNARLRELDQMKTRFFNNISHEFRTPLTLTIGPLDDLREGLYGPVNDEQAEQVDLSLRNARRVLRLINQILDVARLEAGRMDLHAYEQDLAAFLGEIARSFVPLAERKHVTLSVERSLDPLPVYFDPDAMEKVLGNLMSNALKFTPTGGSVRVSVAEQDGQAVVAVADTGPGIAEDDLGHLFERFYQASESEQHFQAGTGIGLALVKELVELHGGTIRVESRLGAGTTFKVALPLGKEHLAPEQIAEAPETPLEQPSAEVLERYADLPAAPADDALVEEATPDDVTTVLVVDDNAEVRAFVRRHLAPHYRIVEAADGEEGLAQARAELPDLVLSDVMMPKMDGDALCRAIKTDPELGYIPVILLTARASMEGKLQGLGEGADDYLTKPFETKELIARVSNLIETRRRLKARWQGDGSGVQPGLHPSTVEVTSADAAFLEQVREAIEANLAEEDFTVAQLAAELGQSRKNLHRRLKALLGQTPSEVLQSMRLERAAQLLSQQAGLVSEVAYGVGFKSVSYFCKCFRQKYDSTPAAYMQAHAGDFEKS